MHRDDADRAGAAERCGGHGWAGERLASALARRARGGRPGGVIASATALQSINPMPSRPRPELLLDYAQQANQCNSCIETTSTGKLNARPGSHADSFRIVTMSQDWSNWTISRSLAPQRISGFWVIFGYTGPWCPALSTLATRNHEGRF
jgi:hypothetical protein